MNVLLAQMPIVDADVGRNLEAMLEIIEGAGGSADLIVFPETTLCGFPDASEIDEVAMTLDSQPIQLLKAAARRGCVALAFGVAERDGADFYNTAVLLDREGRIALRYRKSHLWPHTDRGVFRAGDAFVVSQLDGVKIGLIVCYDVEFPEASRALARLGAQLILVLDGNMSPYGPVHRRAVTARAMENQCFAVLVNRIGGGRGLDFAGESMAVDPNGEVIDEVGATTPLLVTLDLSAVAASRRDYDYLQDARLPAVKVRASLSVDGVANHELMIGA
ncbi:carbon-nitrogen hydrolase family protein [Pseudomonas aeruginosa]|nr:MULTISPECIES: carbon-nitrogen hydrolase family protein [Pseudomonas]MCS7747798.1 carbon-nitrogen hydrolase family protein [Pseudomonas aeruginosa]MCS8000851.1 carbon-nitrogen hydrolase family protein [Pseudomonas aeruginosa]MCS9648531.1 carbon-nitrogen hydrolase family protein [Pseudomonas aeruginosa]HCR1545974.1 carbon-nitrogen hydrolase family protein [Pseudomonas aeruginosa]HEJ6538132.1 carbon-nitrogen hydrolase family protein [Pseudomonas aeruginosa]